MKIIGKLIGMHRFLFGIAVLVTLLTVAINLYWNCFLSDMINLLESMGKGGTETVSELLPVAIVIILVHTISEYLSVYLAAYICEMFAHELRMGYARFYLQNDVRTLSTLNVGEEQSAMQNELREISAYLYENLFALMKQFVSFVLTVVFLFWQNFKLALLSILPVVPLIFYCSFASRVIKSYTEACQGNKKEINGWIGTLLELFPVIKVYKAYKLVDNSLKERLAEWKSSNIKKERVAARLMSLSGVFSFVPLLILLGVGGTMAIHGQISLGVFYIFINLSGNVSGFLQNMPNVYAGFRRFGASIGRLESKLVFRKR